MPATVVKWCKVWGNSFTNDTSGSISATNVYLVEFDSAVTSLSEVLALAQAESGFPQMGDPYDLTSIASFGLGLTAQSFTPKEYDEQQNLVFTIEVTYSNSAIAVGSPTVQPWNCQWGSIKEGYVPDQTLFNTTVAFPSGKIKPVLLGMPIVNTASDNFDPPVTSTKVIPTITLQKNFTNITDIGSITDILDLMERVGTVNDDIVTIAGIDFDYFQGKIEDINISWSRENGQEFFNFSITISFNKEYHVAKVLNAGYNKFNTVTGKLEKIMVNGADATVPQLLDINGAPIVAATPALRNAAAIYRAFGIDRMTSFGDLDLPEQPSNF